MLLLFHFYCILRAHARAGSPGFESNCHVFVAIKFYSFIRRHKSISTADLKIFDFRILFYFLMHSAVLLLFFL